MWNSVFSWKEGGIEDFARVATGEAPGLRDGVEDLVGCCAVDGKVVDGFVGDWVVRDKARFG